MTYPVLRLLSGTSTPRQGSQSGPHGSRPSAQETNHCGQASLSPTQQNIDLPPSPPSWVSSSKKRQGVRWTNPKPPPPSSPNPLQAVSSEEPLPQFLYNKLFLQVSPTIKTFTDNTGRFPILARSIHQYVMIAYPCNDNMILAVPFKTREDTHRLQAYNKIMQLLRNHNLHVY